MRTPSPCKLNGVPCEKRTMGCHSGCEEYRLWEAVHAAELEQERKAREGLRQAEDFRAKLDTRTKFIRKGRKN